MLSVCTVGAQVLWIQTSCVAGQISGFENLLNRPRTSIIHCHMPCFVPEGCLLAKEIDASNNLDQKGRRYLESFASLAGKCCVGDVQLHKGRRGDFLISRESFQPSNVLE